MLHSTVVLYDTEVAGWNIRFNAVNCEIRKHQTRHCYIRLFHFDVLLQVSEGKLTHDFGSCRVHADDVEHVIPLRVRKSKRCGG